MISPRLLDDSRCMEFLVEADDEWLEVGTVSTHCEASSGVLEGDVPPLAFRLLIGRDCFTASGANLVTRSKASSGGRIKLGDR